MLIIYVAKTITIISPHNIIHNTKSWSFIIVPVSGEDARGWWRQCAHAQYAVAMTHVVHPVSTIHLLVAVTGRKINNRESAITHTNMRAHLFLEIGKGKDRDWDTLYMANMYLISPWPCIMPSFHSPEYSSATPADAFNTNIIRPTLKR